MARHACSFVRCRFGFPLHRIDCYEWIWGLVSLMKRTALDRHWFICYVAVFCHFLLASVSKWKLWEIGLEGVEHLPLHQVDLFLRGSLGGQEDRLCRGIPVVQDLPVYTIANVCISRGILDTMLHQYINTSKASKQERFCSAKGQKSNAPNQNKFHRMKTLSVKNIYQEWSLIRYDKNKQTEIPSLKFTLKNNFQNWVLESENEAKCEVVGQNYQKKVLALKSKCYLSHGSTWLLTVLSN